MAFYPDVYPGQKAVKTASEENTLRHMLNAGDGMSDRSGGHGQSRSICVCVYNATRKDIPAGVAVRIDEKAEAEPFPVKTVDSDYDGFYGVLKTPLAPNAVGSMIVSGVALLSRAVGKPFAVPHGEGWKGKEDGGLLVLNPSNKERALAVIGDGTASGNQFEEFCKSLTNFCYIDGNEIVVTPGRARLDTGRRYFWTHDELRFPKDKAIAARMYANVGNSAVRFEIIQTGSGTQTRPSSYEIMLCSAALGLKGSKLTRYHVGGDIVFTGLLFPE